MTITRQQRRAAERSALKAARHVIAPRPTKRLVFANPSSCSHVRCPVAFDPDDANLDAHEIQRRWPRFFGQCPDCGSNVIMYASALHYIAGDW